MENEPYEKLAELYLDVYANNFDVDKVTLGGIKRPLLYEPKLVFIFNFEKAHIAIFKLRFGKYQAHTIYEKNNKLYFTNLNSHGDWERLFSNKKTFIKSFLESELLKEEGATK